MRRVNFQDLTRAIAPLQQDIGDAMNRVARSGQFLRGRETADFEAAWAAYCGQEHCVLCANGTDAITLSALALGLAVANVPAITCWYTAEGLWRGGCRSEAAEVDSAGKLAAPNAQSVPVPLYGSAPSLAECACMLFDGAQAHGWRPPRHAVVTWSFYPTKTLGALGDCGAVTTNDASLADEIRVLAGRDDCFRDRRQIVSRADEMQAAILNVKLKHLDHWIEQRREVARWYWQSLPQEIRPVYRPEESSFHLFPVFCEGRAALSYFLRERGVETKAHYDRPIHKYPAEWSPSATLPRSEYWCDHVLSLPCYPGITKAEVDYVADCTSKYASQCNALASDPSTGGEYKQV